MRQRILVPTDGSTLSKKAVIDAVTKARAGGVAQAKGIVARSRKGIKRVLLGSETQHVLTHSKLPILVLR